MSPLSSPSHMTVIPQELLAIYYSPLDIFYPFHVVPFAHVLLRAERRVCTVCPPHGNFVSSLNAMGAHLLSMMTTTEVAMNSLELRTAVRCF